MIVRIPPGPRYLALGIPRLLAPSILAALAKHTIELYLDRPLWPGSPWIPALVCTLASPGYLFLRVQWRNWREWLGTWRSGAPMPPRVPLKRWGGLDFLFAKRDAEFPGEFVGSQTLQVGSTFNVRLLFNNRIVTTEPANIKAVLATEFPSFEKGDAFRRLAEPLLGSGVFAADGDMWKFHRQMTRPFFHRERITDFDLFDHHAENAIKRAKERLREGIPIDFQDMVSRFTMDAASSFLFGHDVRSLDAGLPYPGPHYTTTPIEVVTSSGASVETETASSDAFSLAFQTAQTVIGLRNRFGDAWPLGRDDFWGDRMTAPMKLVRAFLDPILRDGVRRAASDMDKERIEEDDGDSASLLDHLVRYTQDEQILRDQILNISVAGRDTTASLLTFAVYMLAEHPDILAKLRAEILGVVGTTERPTFENLRDMKYLRAVLNETLRLYSPVPFNQRTSLNPTLFQTSSGSPLYIPANTLVIFSTFAMHRRADLWGPDVLEFDPERFLDARLHKYVTANPFVFLPFSAGPRICLGQQFAYNKASLFLVRLLQSFSTLSLALDAQPPQSLPPPSWRDPKTDMLGWKRREKVRPRAHLTLYVMGGLWLRMGEAGGESGSEAEM
ncbi:Cytochrome P450 [Mycena kentingensis (nom. inval.)]|nr:Cytochrome P450 [Mycena kentingensis (nom. inval.)]